MRALFRTAAIALAGFMLACPPRAGAGDVRPCPNKAGSWQMRYEKGWAAPYALSPQEAKAFADTLGTIAEILHQTKVVNPPMGLDAKTLVLPIVTGSADYAVGRFTPESSCDPHPCRTGLVRGELHSIFYHMGDWGDGKGCVQYWNSEIATHAWVSFNALETAVDSMHYLFYGGMQDLDGQYIYYEPRKVLEIQGFPLYDYVRLVITNIRKPLWLPLPQEQFLRLLIHKAEAEVARLREEAVSKPREIAAEKEKRRKAYEQMYDQLKRTDPKEAEEVRKIYEETERQIADFSKELSAGLKQPIELVQQDVAKCRARLASLSASERKAQAWYLSTPETALCPMAPANTPGATPLVKLNPDFFDRSLPRTALQLMTVDIHWDPIPTPRDQLGSVTVQQAEREKDPGYLGVARLYELLHTADWRKIASLLAQPSER